jgi:tight adherence protein C
VGDYSVWIFTFAVALAAVSLIWAGVASFSAMFNPMRRRLKALREPEGDQGVAASSAVTQRSSGIARFFEPKKEGEREGYRLRLVQAGFRSPAALGIWFSAKLFLAVSLPVVAFLVLRANKFPMIEWAAILLAATFLGSVLPDYVVNRKFEGRKRALMEGLPDALDLLVTCTEAGLGLNAAMERVVEQLPASSPELAYELGQVNAEIRAGVDRNVALKNLGLRSGVDEIHGLVSLISHSTRLGTGVAGTLRIYSEEFRDRRMQRAEEIAATIGTKLLFPLLLCMFPSFFIVAIGPAFVRVMKMM